jgi:hypothetical protein
MGATESTERILNKPLQIKQDFIIEEVDLFYSPAFELVRMVEEERCEFMPIWNKFVRMTGGVVLTKPTFEACVTGMLWKFAHDLNGSLKGIDILEVDPYLVVSDDIKLTMESSTIADSFFLLCRYFKENYYKVARLELELSRMESEIQEYSKDPDAIMQSFDVAPIDTFSYTKMLNMNNRRISNAYQIIHLIKEELDDIQKGLNRFSYWFKNDIGKVSKWEKIGKDVYNLKNIKDRSKATRIMYMFSREAKLTSYEDHYDVIEDDLIAEEEAKYELEGMRKNKEEKKERQKQFVGESISQLSHSQSMMNKSCELGREYQYARKDTREEPLRQSQEDFKLNYIKNDRTEKENNIRPEIKESLKEQEYSKNEDLNISQKSSKKMNASQSREEDVSSMKKELEELRKSNVELQHKLSKMSTISKPFEINLDQNGLEGVYNERKKSELRQPQPL